MMSMISRNNPHSRTSGAHGRNHSTTSSAAATQANHAEPQVTIEVPKVSFGDFIGASREVRKEVTQLKPLNLDKANGLRENIEFNQTLFPHPETSIEFLSTETDENKIVEPLCNLLETLDLIIQARVNLLAGRAKLVGPESKLDLPLKRITEEISYSILNTFFYPFAADSRDILSDIVHNLKTITNADSIIDTLKKRNEDLVRQIPAREPNSQAPVKKADFVVLDSNRRLALLHAVEARQAA